jgi:hypothetical protein
MKLISILLLICQSSFGATYYVSTTGSDAAAGTIGAPWATWQHGFETASAGDVVYIRGGVYHPVITSAFGVFLDNKDGSAGSLIRIYAYPGEVPIMDMSTNTENTVGNYGIRMDNCDYWYLKGLHVTGASQHDLAHAAAGILMISCNHNILEQVQSYANEGPGMRLQYDSEDNFVHNCDFYNNYDPHSASPGGNADGIDMAAYERAGNERRNHISGCRAYQNSDDGFDFVLNSGFVTIDSCWAWRNGYQASGNGCGFKLGENDGTSEATPQRLVHNCLSFLNKTHGFSQNESTVRMDLFNNTSFDNVNTGFFFYWQNIVNTFRNNISYSDANTLIKTGPTNSGTNVVEDHNTWNGGVTISSADFVSVDSTGVSGARQSNGNLPSVNFLKLIAGSDLINAGVDVGIPYLNSAPDLGAFEFVTPPVVGSGKVIYQSGKSITQNGKIIRQ